MKRIYSVLVENRAGVLCKVSGLFSRRCFNIDSLAVGETEDPEVSCMTIVSSGNERTIEQIEKQLNKKLDVIKVKTFEEKDSISRELMLIKVKYNKTTRRDIDLATNELLRAYKLNDQGLIRKARRHAVSKGMNMAYVSSPQQLQKLSQQIQSGRDHTVQVAMQHYSPNRPMSERQYQAYSNS